MSAVHQIIDDAPDTIPIPAEMRHRRLEIIFQPLDEIPEEKDANGWPIGFFESTFGSIPDLPEREPQGKA
ncbi:hypothetical protein [Methylomagnum sp.]